MGLFFYHAATAWFYGLAPGRRHWADSPGGCRRAVGGNDCRGLADHYFFNLQFPHSVVLFWMYVGLGMAAIRIGSQEETGAGANRAAGTRCRHVSRMLGFPDGLRTAGQHTPGADSGLYQVEKWHLRASGPAGTDRQKAGRRCRDESTLARWLSRYSEGSDLNVVKLVRALQRPCGFAASLGSSGRRRRTRGLVSLGRREDWILCFNADEWALSETRHDAHFACGVAGCRLRTPAYSDSV